MGEFDTMSAYPGSDAERAPILCSKCSEAETDSNPIEERYSLGVYAGRYHAKCWEESGYRDEPASAFDPMDAGETMEPDEWGGD